VTVEATREGTVMGTAGYMSPEQARGVPTDKRTDIWAFGCVLYEMLAGRKAFPGKTISDFIAAVLTGEPEWEALPVSTPANVQALLRRCLQKDPQKRLRDIGDARLELEEPPLELASAPAQPASRTRLAALGAAAVVVGAMGALLFAWALWRQAPAAVPVVRFAVKLPPDQVYTPSFNPGLALSADGTQLVYRTVHKGQAQLFLRHLGEFEAKPIPGTEGGTGPYFSPDGRSLYVSLNLAGKKYALSGGAPVPLFEGGVQGLSWAAEDAMVFANSVRGGIFRASAAGGKPELLIPIDEKKGERSYRFPQWLPERNAVLFTVSTAENDTWDDAQIVVENLRTKERRTLVQGGAGGRYLAPGYLVYARAGALLAAPFDVNRLAVTGSSVSVLEGVSMQATTGVANFSLSANGSLAYAPGVAGGVRRLFWVDRQGKAEPFPQPPRGYLHPRFSPDGRTLAIEVEGSSHDFWLCDLERGTFTRMTTDGRSHWPLWTPDGRRLTFRVGMPGPFMMWWMPADRSGGAEQLTRIGTEHLAGFAAGQSPASWSPDGKAVAFTQMAPPARADVWVLEMEGDRKPRPFAQSKFSEGAPRFSPDGKWIAYVSDETGRNEVYVQSYPGPGPKIQMSADGGTDPVWASRTGELFYRNEDKMMVVAVTLQPRFNAGKPRLLWTGHYSHGMSGSCGPPGTTSSNYDVTPDGQRFLKITDSEQDATPTQVNVVLNWVEEVKRVVEEKGRTK